MVILCVSKTNGSNNLQKEEEIETNKSKILMDVIYRIVCATTVTFPSTLSCGKALSSIDWCNVIDKADYLAVTAKHKITGVVVGGGAGSLCHTRQSPPLFVLHLPTTPLNWSVISSSTFRFTRDPPSHQKSQDLYGTMVTASDVASSTWGGTEKWTLLVCYSGAHIKDVTTTISFRVKSNCSTSDNDSDDQSAMYKTIPFNKPYVDPVAQYKRNWGISTKCRLLGGGETTGNGTATAGWGNPGPTPVPASVSGTSNWNTSPHVDGQSPPNAASNGPWQQSPQSSSTSSNNTSQTSNIGNKGQSSNSGSSSGNSTTSTSQSTNQQNTTSWAQAAGKNLPVSTAPQVLSNSSTTTTTATTTSGGISNPQSSNSPPTNGSVNSSTKQQLEQINTMREALYSQDGWGGQHVNQDSQWEVSPSPEPNTKDGPLTGLTGGPGWSKVNNGTDLWEATLRNGGQPPIQIPVQNTPKAPWGHTPASNIGGTWGEDDDVSSVSGGVEGNAGNWGINPTNTMSNQWGQGQPPPQGPGGPMWGGPPKKDLGPEGQSWNSGNAAWNNDLNRPPGSMDQGPHRREILANGIVDHSRGMGNDARGGISGRLNGTLSGGSAGMEPMWGGPPPHHMQHHVQPPSVGPPPSVIATPGAKLGQGPVPVINQWSGPPPPKDINPMNNNSKGNGWEEPSPTDHRRNLLNYDDGTSLWGNSQTRPNVPGGGLLNTQHNMNKHWGKADMAAAVAAAAVGRNNNGSGNMGNQCPPGVPPNRAGMPPTKMVDQQLWPGNPRNGTWGDIGGGSQHDLNVTAPWGEDRTGLSGNAGGPWPNSEWGPGPKSKNSWGDCNNEMDQGSWGQKNMGPKNQNKDFIWQSKSYRVLAEMGVKKEDVEAVTRSYNISMEEAVEFLLSTRGPGGGGGGGIDSWNSHGGRGQHPDDQNPYDRSSINQQRFGSQQLPFAVPSIGNNSNQQHAMLQKLLAQQPPAQQQNSMQQQYSQGNPRQMQNQPTAQQLRMLVQQIQMAVQAGYLNHQILNQPLAPQTLIMLNQLLQQIKILQQNLQIHAAVVNNPKSGPAVVSAAMAITKARQQIASLQNQIANNQAIHMKAQAHQNQSNFGSGLSNLMSNQTGDFFKNDPLALLHTGFSELAVNKDSQIPGQGFQTSQQSRLNQWKLPNLDKDDLGMGNDFSRAPGPNSKSTPGSSSPTFNSLLSQADGGWPDNAEDNKEGWPNGSNPQSNSSSSAFASDLVPEFEPGKPWKGNQIKNIEDDPTITPGSVVRSPLSLAASMKDSNNSDLFNNGGKTSPSNSQSAVDMPITPLSLSSTTWSFNPPPSSTQSSFTSPLGKVNGPKNSWADGSSGNDLWGGVLGTSGKSRGPPPGLTGGSTKPGNAPNNSWPRWPSNNSASWQSSSNNVASTWLLLRNLTQQIDGSTLKTLCVQHGPLLSFHMYLNHGIALAKYSSREEANKAQGALNNCVLGNTTIFAESPTDAEVQMLLTHLSGGGSSASSNNSAQQQSNWNNGRNGNGGNSQGQQGSDTWANSQLWGGNNSAGPPGNSTLWGAGADQIDPHRTTPSSSLNSFMPGDLLGSETM